MFGALLSGTHNLGELVGLKIKLPGTIHYAGVLLTARPSDLPEGGLPSIHIRLHDSGGFSYIVAFVQETPSHIRFTVKRDE